MKPHKIFILWLFCFVLVGCTSETEKATAPVNLALLVDQALVEGDAVRLAGDDGGEPLWEEVFREDFTENSWQKWVPAPNQVPPPKGNPELQKRWLDAVRQLEQSAKIVPVEASATNETALRVDGTFDLQWVGYVLPVKVEGGRRYRISSRVKVEHAAERAPAKVGFVGFLELAEPLERQSIYQAENIAPYILMDQKSPGAVDVEQEWREESFSLTLHEKTETLLLYVCAYHGDGMDSLRVLFDELRVEQLSVQPVAEYLQREYLTPWTSRVKNHKELFKVAGWGNPTELSHHLEGLVSPGASQFRFPLGGKAYSSMSFHYGPLREFASLDDGQLVFAVEVNGQEVFTDLFDFSKGEGKQGWRSTTIPIAGAVESVVLKTKPVGVSQNLVGFWGAPRLLASLHNAPRNVMVVCIDSLRKDFVGAYGGVDAMPVFGALAKDGVAYDNYVSAGNTTRYALTAMMTGQYAGRNGLALNSVYDQLSLEYRQQFADNVPVLPGWFRDNGYVSFASIDNPFFLPVETGLHMGFTEVYNHGEDEHAYRAITDKMIAFLQGSQGQPYLAFVHYDPHYLDKLQLTGIPEVDAKRIQTGYFLELEAINAQVERLIDGLRQMGLYDSTDIVLVSDHGESLDPELTGHGYFLNPDQVVVPLVIKSSGQEHKEASLHVTTPLSSVDLAPWLSSEHGLPIPQGFSGHAGNVDGEMNSEQVIFSEGINQHRLLVMNPAGTYLLHSDGQESLFGRAMLTGQTSAYRQYAVDFLMSARPGLYLLITGEESETIDVRFDGMQGLKVFGRQENDVIEIDKRASFALQSGDAGRVLFFAEEMIDYPARLHVKRQKKDALIGLSPDFLPTGQGELIINNAEELHRLVRPAAPSINGRENVVLAWYSQGIGVKSIAAEQNALDPAMRSMLQRWGYIK